MADQDQPKPLDMPDLEGLDKSLRSKRTLGNMLGIHGPPTLRGKQIADGYVRLVEKTVLEYDSARDKLVAFLQDGTLDDYSRAQDHFESCVHSLHRAILYLERLRRLGFRQADGSPFVPRPRDLEVLSDNVRARVRQLRDASEHLDADIIDGRIPPNAEVAIHLGWNQAQLAGMSVQYTEIAKWIRQLHHFAVLLSRVQIVVTNPDVRDKDEGDA
jgi:hypothetical protein